MQKFIGIVLGLLSILLMASTCDPSPPPPVSCKDQKTQAYTIATQVSGELAIGDCGYPDNTSDSQPRVDYYKFTLDKQTDVTFYLQPDSFSPEWSVFNSENAAVVPTSFGRTGTKQLPAGEYVIAVRGRGQLGKYTLSTSTTEKGFGGCLTLPTSDLGSSANGELDITDCFFFNESSRVEYYEFELSEQDDVTIDLRSSEIGIEWYLYTRGGNREIQSFSNTETKQLAPGKYVIAVVGRSGTLGKYKVTTTTTSKGFSGCLELADYALGTTINGVLEITDCQAADSASYVDYYTFILSQQQNVSLTLDSTDLSKFMGLYERDGTRVSESFSGIISPTQLARGTYVVLVSRRGGLGTYTLTSTVE